MLNNPVSQLTKSTKKPSPHTQKPAQQKKGATQSKAKPTIRPIDILPRLLAPNHILHLLPLHILALVVLVIDQELVRACAAFEAVLAFGEGEVRGGGAGEGEDVGAGGADWVLVGR